MQVNVYAARAQLSRLLDQAARGEGVVITRQGRPVARLVAQALEEGLTIVTRDRALSLYTAPTLWG